MELSKVRLQRPQRGRTNKRLVPAKPTMSQEEAEQAERVRQQAEQELLAMCEADGDEVQTDRKKKPQKKSKKKKPSQASNRAAVDDGASAEGEVDDGASARAAVDDGASAEGKVDDVGTTVCAAGDAEGTYDRSRDAANLLLAQTIQEVRSQQPSQQGLARLEASLAQATSADQELITQATQQRKAIRGKLKKLRARSSVLHKRRLL